MAAKRPQSVHVTLIAHKGRGYSAHLSGWAVDELGHFGSSWTRDLDLDVPREATSAELLLSLAAALERAVSG